MEGSFARFSRLFRWLLGAPHAMVSPTSEGPKERTTPLTGELRDKTQGFEVLVHFGMHFGLMVGPGGLRREGFFTKRALQFQSYYFHL